MSELNQSFPNLPTMHERLTYAYKNLTPKKSQTTVAKEVGISQPTFNSLLSGKNQTSTHLKKIVQVLKTDYQWIITGIPSEAAAKNSTSLANIPLLKNYNEHVNTRSKSLINNINQYVQLDVKALNNNLINFHDAFYIPMPDKSMELAIKENASIFVDSSQTLIDDGYTYVVSHGGILLVRQLFNMPLGGIKLIANNPIFDTVALSIDEQQNQAFIILGRVFTVINYY